MAFWLGTRGAGEEGHQSLGRDFCLKNRISSFHPPPEDTLGTFHGSHTEQLIQLPSIAINRS